MNRNDFNKAMFPLIQDFPGVFTVNKTNLIFKACSELPLANFQKIVAHFIGKYPTAHNKYPNLSHFQNAAVDQKKNMFQKKERDAVRTVFSDAPFTDNGKDKILDDLYGAKNLWDAVKEQRKSNRGKK